jgi:hypothetical protein
LARGTLGVKNMAWLDPLLVRMDRFFGYGKRVRTEEVWRKGARMKQILLTKETIGTTIVCVGNISRIITAVFWLAVHVDLEAWLSWKGGAKRGSIGDRATMRTSATIT